MDKLDRLVWADGMSFISYGVRVGLRVNQPDVLAQLSRCLPPGSKRTSGRTVERLYSIIAGGDGPRPNIKLFNLVYANANRIARSAELMDALEGLESDLQLFVAESAPRRVFVHAGVVGWRGKAVLIPGRSFSGKSSLVAELVKRGATYYSDEYAVLDTEGRVHNYARALSIRENGQLAKSTRYDVRALGGVVGAKPLQVGLVFVSSYRERARWNPRTLTSGEGALALMSNTVSARRNPARMLATIQRVVSHATVYKADRADLATAADFILEKLGG